ncbi:MULTISPECIES: hypothetical protein [unclassified Gordonia (in: high G+C Gram-positive bacteria)]|uniref:hypothetical protein n=1 Tax=unclassified Gordonia (in: high G+C Gram-positive bacteria) TaxID=2657482 RepID=UPI00071D8125|nr:MULTISPECIES: hypothetical protein [unclassified Gordonia (in: high G+C Gram-positive bacteria)]KSU53325.1 hypothetical protein AS181_22090 [Gordonia sp. SGD-V-85]SCC56044.1 hypothetical protein GA0061091_12716 [Gordonia sp. v-85]
MRDPLQRIHTIKLALIIVSLSFVGFILMGASIWLVTDDKLSTFVFGIGDVLFTAAALGLLVSAWLARDDEARNDARVDRLLKSNVDAFRKSVIEGFAFDVDDLTSVATPDMLDDITKNSLALRIGDAEFAEEAYEDLRDQAINTSERWYDAKISIHLSEDKGAGSSSTPMIVSTVRWEYTVVPKHASRRFAVVSDRQEYRELAGDSEFTSAWFVRKENGVDASSRDAFELVQFAVDGEQRTIRRAQRKDGQLYTASVGREAVDAQRPVTISYTYRVRTPQRGHMIHFDMEQATRNVDIALDYSDTSIDYVNVLDFFVSSHKTRIEHMPPNVPERSIAVSHTGWVLPRSGVAFVWVARRSGASSSSEEPAVTAATAAQSNN